VAVDFAIPALPPSLNRWARAHWSERAKAARTWRLLVRAHAPRLPVPVSSAEVGIIFEYQVRRSGKRTQDADGLAKLVLDALVAEGIIEDDGWPHLRRLVMVARPGDRDRTTVRVRRA
jgi:Holliday junction resolvase RusA-like endonuclease